MKLVKLIFIGILLCSNAYAYGSGGCDKNAVFLNHWEGVDAATTSPEADCPGNGKHVLTFQGNAQLDTAQKVFGKSSILFDGTGDYVDLPSSTEFAMGTGDFTWEARVRFSGVASIQFFQNDPAANSFAFAWYNTAGNNLKAFLAGTEFLFSWSPSADVWYHVAVTRQGTNLRAFINGVQIGVTQSSSNDIPAVATQIGGSSTVYFLGWMDEYRITKGVARWTANFTPPSTPYCSGCEQAGFAIND